VKNRFEELGGSADLEDLKSALLPYLGLEAPQGKITEEMTRALENIGYIAREKDVKATPLN
jgi:hypothetical protein